MIIETPPASRQQLRQQIRQARRSLSEQQQQQAAAAAACRMLNFLTLRALQQPVEHIALYLTFDGELDTHPLIQALWQAGKQLYLPRLHPFSPGNLLFLHYQPDTRLQQDQLKIYQPVLNVRQLLPLSKLDILITPLVAFDHQGQRLGMGGGFYDRTLQHWQRYHLFPIGYAHDCQCLTQLPSESWDVPLPAIVTPSRLWQW